MRTSKSLTAVMSAGGVHVFRFAAAEALDLRSLREVRRYCAELSKNGRSLRAVLDLDSVGLLTSEGLGLIVAISSSLGANGGQLHLANVPEPTRRTLEIARLNGVLKTFETTNEAVAAFR